MKPTQKQEALAEVMRYLIDRYPRVQVPEQTVAAYCADLGEIPIDRLRAAAALIVRTQKYFPSIAEIFAADEQLHARRPQPKPPEEEWGWVLELACDSGAGRETAGHEIAERVIKIMGGWQAVGLWEVDSREWRRKEFVQTYNAILEREKDEWFRGTPPGLPARPDPVLVERTGGGMQSIGGSEMLRRIAERKDGTDGHTE